MHDGHERGNAGELNGVSQAGSLDAEQLRLAPWTGRSGARRLASLLGVAAIVALALPVQAGVSHASGGSHDLPTPTTTPGAVPTDTHGVKSTPTPIPGQPTPRSTCAPTPASQIYSFSLYPSTVRGGYSVVAQVYISTIAPCGGALVTLTSADPTVANPPATLLIPAGSSWATVSFATAARSTTGTTTVTATGGTSSLSTAITVTP